MSVHQEQSINNTTTAYVVSLVCVHICAHTKMNELINYAVNVALSNVLYPKA